jgi:hypothetical protein
MPSACCRSSRPAGHPGKQGLLRDRLAGRLREVFPEPNNGRPAADQKKASHRNMRKEKGMSNILIILAVVAVWVLLQIYVLPKFGIST